MDEKWNAVNPARCASWLVLPTVYSDALSYGEQIDKFCYQLNQIIQNNNILPDFISDMIKNYINSGAIGEVVRDILADYILNVKYPPEGITPAVGDGTADDTEAIQGCINYASNNGGCVYFPSGKYLTRSINLKSNVSLFGFDRYTTKLVLKGGESNPLIMINGDRCSIVGVELDCNSGVQVNDVNGVVVLGQDVLISNAIIKDCYSMLNYNGTGGHFQVSDVIMENCVHHFINISGNTTVQFENVSMKKISAVQGEYFVNISSDNGKYDIICDGSCENGVVLDGNKNMVNAIVSDGINNKIIDNGVGNEYNVLGDSEKRIFAGMSDIETGDRSVHVKGILTDAVDGNRNENTGGNKNVVVAGNVLNTYRNSLTENVAKGKITNADSVSISANTGTENYKQGKVISGKSVFVNTDEPLMYGQVENGLVGMNDKNGNPYYLVTNKRVNETNTLYNEFLIDPIVSHIPSEYAGDSDATVKTMTSNMFYSLYDNIKGSELVKTSIGTDNEGKTIYSYKHTARIKKNSRISTYFSDKVNSKCLFMVSGQHGTEKIAILTLFRWLNDEYSKRYSYVLDNYDIIVVPCASPYNIDNNLYYNRNGVNPNRNFPVGFTPSATNGETALDQKQCKALYDFLVSNLNTYGLSLLVMNFHNSDYYVDYPKESKVLWYNVATNSVDMENYNNLFKSTNVVKREILKEYPELDGATFLRFLSTDSDGTLGGQCAGMGIRFVLTEAPMRWTEDGEWFDEKVSYVSYLIVYNAIKAMIANEYYAPYNLIFNRLSQIGCSVDNTLIEVCQKLPITCGIKTLVTGGKTNNLSKSMPTRNVYTGLLEIYKERESDRCKITFSVADGTANAISWRASYDSDYGLSNWQPLFAEMSNVNFNISSIDFETLVSRIGNSAVIRIISSMKLSKILPVSDSGMLFVYSPILPSDFVSHTKVCLFVSDKGGFYINNNNVPSPTNWLTVKEPNG